MKILIYTTHRTGSTSLAQLLMSHYNCDYQREGFYKNKNFLKTINGIENIIIKLTPAEADYNLIRNVFDKCIVLTRNDIRAQAESRLYAEHIKKYFIPYKIDDLFLKEYAYELNSMEEIIKKENEILNKYENCLQITYEDLYYNNGLKKIEEYLNTTMILKLDNSKKYRNGKRNII
jgi:predicted DNA-binding protein YlxM (UPF0122 family)